MALTYIHTITKDTDGKFTITVTPSVDAVTQEPKIMRYSLEKIQNMPDLIQDAVDYSSRADDTMSDQKQLWLDIKADAEAL